MVLAHKIAIDILLKHVDLCCCKLARAHPLLEEQVQLSKGAASRFRHPVVDVYDAKERAPAL